MKLCEIFHKSLAVHRSVVLVSARGSGSGAFLEGILSKIGLTLLTVP